MTHTDNTPLTTQTIRAVSSSSSDANKTLINRKSVNYLMISYANIGDAVGAFDVLSRYKNTGFTPDTKTINTILKAIENSADPKHIQKLDNFASHFWGNDLVADNLTLRIATNIFKRSGELRAARWLNGLMDHGFSLTNLLLNKLTPYIDDKRLYELCKLLGPEERAERAKAPEPSRELSPLLQPRRSWSPGGASRTGEQVPYKVTGEQVPYEVTGEQVPSVVTGEQVPYEVTGGQVPYEVTGEQVPSVVTGEQVPYEITGEQVPCKVTGEQVPYEVTGEQVPYEITGEQVPYKVREVIMEAQLVKAKYSALLKKYSEVGDTLSIEGILKEMKIRGIPLNMFHCNQLLRCHAFNRSFSQAQGVVKECRDLGLKLTTTTMRHLCEASVRSSDPFNPEQVLLDMQHLGLQPGTPMPLKETTSTRYTLNTLCGP
jgi:hypothetical protein